MVDKLAFACSNSRNVFAEPVNCRTNNITIPIVPDKMVVNPCRALDPSGKLELAIAPNWPRILVKPVTTWLIGPGKALNAFS